METSTVPVKEVTDEECHAAALEWANLMRSEHNLSPLDELPKGGQGNPRGCPLAHALLGLADGSCPVHARRVGLASQLSYAHEGEILTRPIPPLVNEFVLRFDAGHYPDLAI